MSRDWAGFWFKLLNDQKRPAYMRFASIQDEGGGRQSFESRLVPHWEHDGIGAFSLILKEQGIEVPLPELRRELRASLIERIAGIIRYLRFVPVFSARWRRWKPAQSRACTSGEAAVCSALSQEDTQRVRARAKAEGVSLNSYLLYTLGETVRSELNASSGPQLWLIPVNLRGAVVLANPTANCSSCVWVDTTLDQGPGAIQAQIKKRFSESFHWGAWWAINLGRWIREAGMKRVLKHLEQIDDRWCGTFSNLGSWDVALSPWAVFPPATAAAPLAAGCMTVGGRLSLSMQTHPALCTDVSITGAWLDLWIKKLVSA